MPHVCMLCKYILRQQKRSRCRKCVSLMANNKILNLHPKMYYSPNYFIRTRA